MNEARQRPNAVLWIAIPTIVGAVLGALLAEPGDFWGNTAPSTATFALVGLIAGTIAWAIARRAKPSATTAS